MKALYAILAVYILALSFAPCADSVMGEHQHAITHHDGEHDHDGDDPSGDDCSPFCHCQCCHTNVVTSDPNLTESATMLHVATPDVYLNPHGFLNADSLDHPPRA